MSVCNDVRMQAYKYIIIRICEYASMQVCRDVCMIAYVCAHVGRQGGSRLVGRYVCMYATCTYAHVHFICISNIYVYIHIYIYKCILIHSHSRGVDYYVSIIITSECQ